MPHQDMKNEAASLQRFGIRIQTAPYIAPSLSIPVGAEPDFTPSSPFSFADEIYGYTRRLMQTLYYFLAAAVLIIGMMVWAFLGLPRLPIFVVVLIGLYGLILLIAFPFEVWNSVRLIRPVRRWMEDYFRFASVVKFELLPVEGETPEDRILNKLAEVYPEVERLRKRAPRSIQRQVGLRRKSRLVWDVVCDVNYPRFVPISWFHRYFGTPAYFLIRRFPGPELISAEDLNVIGEGLKRDLHRPRPLIRRILVVSVAGFTPDAVNAVESRRIRSLSKFDVLLVTELPSAYRLPIRA